MLSLVLLHLWLVPILLLWFTKSSGYLLQAVRQQLYIAFGT